MRNFLRNLSLMFSAGCLGGLVSSLVAWLFGARGINTYLHVNMAPALSAQWLYPRIVWGGVWGLLFILPIIRSNLLAGLLYSLAPTAVQLFITLPIKQNAGIMGIQLGKMTPLLVLFLNAVWGIAAAIWLIVVAGRQRPKKRAPRKQQEEEQS